MERAGTVLDGSWMSKGWAARDTFATPVPLTQAQALSASAAAEGFTLEPVAVGPPLQPLPPATPRA
jgi:hypothetical protein